jgi:hypothetical protein
MVCVTAAASVWVKSASACGGLFCSVATTVGIPIDQNAERVVFEIGEESVTTHVQLQVVGDASDFAWIVPLPAVPTFGTTDVDWLDDLDAFTSVQFTLPQADRTGCSNPSAPRSQGGMCTGDATQGVMAISTSDGGRSAPEGQAVIHYGTQEFGEYVADVVGGTDTAAVVEWLQEHDYNITDNMIPVLSGYNTPGMVFAALKLSRPNGGEALTPVRFEVPGGEPCVPLRLTAVSAQPLMGVQVIILDDQPWVPSTGTFEEIDPDALSLYPDGSTNYFAWVARRTAEAGGQHFVRERVVTIPEWRKPYFRHSRASRFYTRLSPEDMTIDPIFVPAPEVEDTAAVDLTDHAPLWGCLSDEELAARMPTPCANTFCGDGATCVDGFDGLTPGCVCRPGQVVQQFLDPAGRPTVTCVAAQNPVGVTNETVGAGSAFDPCLPVDCGLGTCVLRGGFPTCACATAALAYNTPEGTPRCSARPKGAIERGAGALPPPRWYAPPATRSRPPFPWPIVGLVSMFALLLLARRLELRRRARRRRPAPRGSSPAFRVV